MNQFSYRPHRFPPPIIQHAVWLYQRSTFNTISSPGRPCGSSEPKRPRNGKTLSQQHEVRPKHTRCLPTPRYRDKALQSVA